MNLHLLSIPEAAGEIPKWLEQQIMSPNFGEFVAQLKIVRDANADDTHASSGPNKTSLLEKILGETQDSVLEHGLVSCSKSQIRNLLANPTALLELQSEVYSSGSDYWLNRVDSNNADSTVMEALKTKVENASSAAGLAGGKPKKSDRRSFGLAMLTLAAGIAIVASVYSNMGGNAGGPALARWGWLAEDAIPKDVSPSEYLAKLAEGGEQWSEQDVSTSDKYIDRLKDMQTGCSMLVGLEHPLLSPEDKKWLVDKCKAWQVKFDEQLFGVNSDPQRFKDYLNQTNETVESLVKALNIRSDAI